MKKNWFIHNWNKSFPMLNLDHWIHAYKIAVYFLSQLMTNSTRSWDFSFSAVRQANLDFEKLQDFWLPSRLNLISSKLLELIVTGERGSEKIIITDFRFNFLIEWANIKIMLMCNRGTRENDWKTILFYKKKTPSPFTGEVQTFMQNRQH